MDAPPQHEDVRPFVAVAEWLAQAGLTAPEILARDMERGLLLLGDFGDWRLREYLDDDSSRERELYELAAELLEREPSRYLTHVLTRLADLHDRRGERDQAYAALRRAVGAQAAGQLR